MLKRARGRNKTRREPILRYEREVEGNNIYGITGPSSTPTRCGARTVPPISAELRRAAPK